MALQPEHGAVFKLDSTTGGSLTDYSAYVKDITPPSGENAVGTYYNMASRLQKTMDGGLASSFSVKVYRDPAAASLDSVLSAWLLAGGLRTYQLDMPDSSAGSRRHTGECRLASYTPGNAVAGSGEAAAGTANFTVDSGDTVSTL